MTQEFSQGSDNYNSQSPERENLTSAIFLAEVTRDLRATNPVSDRHSTGMSSAPGGLSDSYNGSPVTNNRNGSTSGSATEANTGAVSRTTDEQLNFKDDSLFCGETQAQRAASYLNWNLVPAAIETIGYCQGQASTPKSFTNFMQNVVKHDTFWGAEIELEYSTDKKLGVQVSGFSIK